MNRFPQVRFFKQRPQHFRRMICVMFNKVASLSGSDKILCPVDARSHQRQAARSSLNRGEAECLVAAWEKEDIGRAEGNRHISAETAKSYPIFYTELTS